MLSPYQQTINRFSQSTFKLSQAGFWSVLAFLAMLLILTRSHHFFSLHSLPGASYAVFLLGGFYLRNKFAFGFFISLALALDLIAVTWGGVDNFCVSPAYPFLLPAYGLIWLSGMFAAQFYAENRKFYPMIPLTIIVGSLLCELVASGSFYFFSGRFVELSLAEFFNRVVTYYPASLQATVFYVAGATIFHLMFLQLDKYRFKARIG